MYPNASISSIAGIGPELAARLQKLAIYTVEDLLTHFPRRYDDWTITRPIKSLRIEESATIQATIRWVKSERSPRRRMAITKALFEDPTGEMLAMWFNQPFLSQTLKPNQTYYFRGTVGYDQTLQLKQLLSPQFELRAQILPLYPETAGISSKQFRRFIKLALEKTDELTDPLSPKIMQAENLLERLEAVRLIHQPQTLGDVQKAQERFAFEELFLFFLRLGHLKRSLARGKSPEFLTSEKDLKHFVEALPFELTDGQRKIAWQVIQEMQRSQPMNRLVQGDVGSGKTVIAAFAAYVAAKSGYQVAWMVPTELLAQQHIATVSDLLKPFEIPIHRITGSSPKTANVFEETPAIFIGTHALLSQTTNFSRLGLVIIDEQHRFGVDQRATLREEQSVDGRKLTPHFLSMTATPIPRTLGLALFGDLELSELYDQPHGRKPITTRMVSPEKRAKAYQFIRDQVALGRQVFVVCPLIEESEEDDTLFAELEKRSALATFESLTNKIFPDLRVGLVHGRLKSKEKQAVMEAFYRHELDILVATAVIEVGINVPNATIMMIEGAERFGLAQLHQLRGRVGRGDHQSYCFLMAQTWNAVISARLFEMERSTNGFQLAEVDLHLRGPGQFIGTAQSGFPHFKLATLMDFPLMKRARLAAERTLDSGLSPLVKKILADQEITHHLE